MLYKNVIWRKQVKIFVLSGNLLVRETQFHVVSCLKSFDFKLFFVCTGVEEPLLFAWNFCFILSNTWLASELTYGSRVINYAFYKTLQKLSTELSKGGPHGISERKEHDTTASPNNHP